MTIKTELSHYRWKEVLGFGILWDFLVFFDITIIIITYIIYKVLHQHGPNKTKTFKTVPKLKLLSPDPEVA